MFEPRLILIDSRAGQSKDCPRPRPITYNKLSGHVQSEAKMRGTALYLLVLVLE